MKNVHELQFNDRIQRGIERILADPNKGKREIDL
jgi:hypothetical protein